MATKSISQLDSAATLDNGDLFETAIPDSGSASGYASKKMSLAQLADYAANDIVYPDFKTSAQSITGAVNQTLLNLADEYDATATYAEGAVVLYAGNLYKCDTAVETPEAFDPTKWTQGKAADFFAGGGDGGECPQVIAVESDPSGSAKTTYTSGSFTMAAGDVLLVGIMHRSALTVPDGFTLIRTLEIVGAGQSLSMIYHTATSPETISATIRQASSVRMSSYWTQIRGATISDTNIYFQRQGSGSVILDIPKRPYIYFLTNNYYSGSWQVKGVEGSTVSNITDIVLYSQSATWLSVVLNFGTAYHTQYQFTTPANDFAIAGVFITNDQEE